MNRAIGTLRQAHTKRFGAFLATDRNGDHFLCGASFTKPDRFFDADTTEWIDGHFRVGKVDTGAVWFYDHVDVRVNDALDSNKNFHTFQYVTLKKLTRTRCSRNACEKRQGRRYRREILFGNRFYNRRELRTGES